MNASRVGRRHFLKTAGVAAATSAGLLSGSSCAVEPPRGAAAAMLRYTPAQVRELRKKFNLKDCWAGGDLTRYVYLHMPEFFTHAVIHRAGPAARLESATEAEVGRVQARPRPPEEKVSLDTYIRSSRAVDAFIVVHKGKVVYERYERMREFDQHLFWSVSKVAVSTLLAGLEDEGLVDASKPVEAYIPELAKSDWKGTSVIDILDMASGMTGLESDDPMAYTDPESPYGLFEGSLGTMPRTPKTKASTYDYVATLKRQKPSGKSFEYSSVNTFVLSWVVENVSRQPYAEALSERIWRRIGAEADALLVVSPVGAPASHGCVSGTLRDLARFGLLFTPSWKVVTDKRVVSAAYLKKIQEGGRPGIYDGANMGKRIIEVLRPERPRHNTYQWDFVLGDGDFFKGGFGGQGLYVSPSRDLVVAFFSSGPDKGLGNPVVFARALARSGLFAT